MELRHLRYFITVAEEGHITRAAERLGIQQPPLSQMIKGIERELDAQLFQRRPRGVELTDAGRAFLENARAVLAQLDRTFETTRRTARGEQGRISVAYSSAAASHPLVPLIIREFREAFPLVSLTLADGFPDDLIESMRNDQIDAAFIGTTVGNMEGMVVDLLRRSHWSWRYPANTCSLGGSMVLTERLYCGPSQTKHSSFTDARVAN